MKPEIGETIEFSGDNQVYKVCLPKDNNAVSIRDFWVRPLSELEQKIYLIHSRCQSFVLDIENKILDVWFSIFD